MRLFDHPQVKAKLKQHEKEVIDTVSTWVTVLIYIVKIVVLSLLLRFGIWLIGVTGVEVPHWLEGGEGILLVIIFSVLCCLVNLKDGIELFEKFVRRKSKPDPRNKPDSRNKPDPRNRRPRD